jgi:hypothetical protein
MPGRVERDPAPQHSRTGGASALGAWNGSAHSDLRDLPAHVIEQAAGTSICAGIHADDGIRRCLRGWPRGRSFFQLR